MKILHLLRHAKSSWQQPELADVDRGLNDRGKRNCASMAREIAQAGYDFKHVYTSPAQRAQKTIELIAEHLTNDQTIEDLSWQTATALYTFDAEQLARFVESLDDAINEVMLVGHNPALTLFCNQLTNANIDNIPTCGYAQIKVNALSWQHIADAPALLMYFVTPKMLTAS
ncbi:phosphoglycerate mutase [Thalassotalea sp. HSM 43]|uniref:SixA phosphatase family protein n=1 Tax=Thalassotalea sp. HSM 43 TaxID=2552945 RepID=UPI001081F85C|nr:histidine phosphatase family protein [Thalassotalea sp. HSM 43]QBY04947.1 phosphoglycerate mutase [Thalassotalea sp. HSM 43]